MKRPLIIILAGLILFAGIILIPSKRSPFGKLNSSFSIPLTDNITSIHIGRGENTVLLSKENGIWLVNNHNEARSSAISFILATLGEVQIKSPVSEELFESLTDQSNTEPVVVRVRGKGVKERFLVYRTANSGMGSVFRKSEKSLPFFMSLPGYDLDPGLAFVTDERYWLPFHVFRLEPGNIERVDLKYRDTGREDISIEVKDSISLSVNDIIVEYPDREHIMRYLSWFSFIPFEKWATDLDPDQKGSILNSAPEIEIGLQLGDSGDLSLKLWIKYMEVGPESEPDTDRLYGELNNSGELFVVKYFDIDPLIKSAEYFIKR